MRVGEGLQALLFRQIGPCFPRLAASGFALAVEEGKLDRAVPRVGSRDALVTALPTPSGVLLTRQLPLDFLDGLDPPELRQPAQSPIGGRGAERPTSPRRLARRSHGYLLRSLFARAEDSAVTPEGARPGRKHQGR